MGLITNRDRTCHAEVKLEAINRERSNLRNQLNDLKKEVLEKNKEIDSLELQVRH